MVAVQSMLSLLCSVFLLVVLFTSVQSGPSIISNDDFTFPADNPGSNCPKIDFLEEAYKGIKDSDDDAPKHSGDTACLSFCQGRVGDKDDREYYSLHIGNGCCCYRSKCETVKNEKLSGKPTKTSCPGRDGLDFFTAYKETVTYEKDVCAERKLTCDKCCLNAMKKEKNDKKQCVNSLHTKHYDEITGNPLEDGLPRCCCYFK
jgi:hypothetical protein